MERMRTTPRVILILKQASSAARPHKTLAQKLAMTGGTFFSQNLFNERLTPSKRNEIDPQTPNLTKCSLERLRLKNVTVVRMLFM